jgi:hypothetical protein
MTTETLQHFAKRTDLFDLKAVDQVRHLAWFVHTSRGAERVSAADLRDCYKDLHLEPPNLNRYLGYLSDGKTKSFIKDRKGYRLEGKARSVLNLILSDQDETIIVKSLLINLVEKITDENEKVFLEETLRCYGANAFRAAIVMGWNLGYHHFITWIFKESIRVTQFNNSIAIKFPKSSITIAKFDDFSEIKEFDVIEICRHAKLIDKNLGELLKEKLKKRNSAAHPSKIVITQAQADDVITDLVNNIVVL